MARSDLEKLLFGEIANVYAVLDGASVKGLLKVLDEKSPPYYCVMRGELSPDVEEVAPYLVGLVPGAPFTDWLLETKPGEHAGIFATSRQSIQEMRKHFRGLFTVYKENGDPVNFRFYDPRVMHSFLPTCNGGELKTFFGPVDKYVAEHEDGTAYSTFKLVDSSVKETVTPMTKGDQ